jgi:hypothetical protein
MDEVGKCVFTRQTSDASGVAPGRRIVDGGYAVSSLLIAA